MSRKYIPGAGDYSDIIDLPHPVSKKHKPMSMDKRAGQFAPFAALTGFGAAVVKAGSAFEEESDRGGRELEEFEDI
ncbi:MAG: hypothetical protein K5981_09685 [Clostridia bacterium]|jgi:hypothetical protein|nr:hypothetical protein [Clostridia bacterium]